jgi:enoyl-CoA hydratase/carnithine racemase
MMAKARFEQDADVGIVTLTDPPLNLVSRAMLDDLEAALDAAHRTEIRALLVRADGEHFSAGAHVADMFQNRSAADAHALLCRVGRMLARCEQLPFPTLGAVNGMCLAGGLEIVLSCDLAWAADDAQLGLVEAVIGAIPFGGGAQRLAERAGPARAREIVMTAGIYDAPTFERWNIINRVVPAADLREKSLRFAHRLAAGPTRAHMASKRVVRAYLDSGIRAADQLIPDLAAPLFETDDMRGGIRSLLEHGPGRATFTGR